jgi:hypothetical protein
MQHAYCSGTPISCPRLVLVSCIMSFIQTPTSGRISLAKRLASRQSDLTMCLELQHAEIDY